MPLTCFLVCLSLFLIWCILEARTELSRQKKAYCASLHLQIFEDQLTLSQPKGADYVRQIVLNHPDFYTCTMVVPAFIVFSFYYKGKCIKTLPTMTCTVTALQCCPIFYLNANDKKIVSNLATFTYRSQYAGQLEKVLPASHWVVRVITK